MQKTPDFMPSFRANLPRNSHVLSHDLGFTATFGHLNPVFHTVLSPGDTVNLGFDFNLRTMPLEAAAFADLVCHTEYFFVPMQLLYQPFDTVFYNITDQFSSLLSGSDIQPNLPLLDMSSIIGDLRLDRSLPAMTYGYTNLPVESIGQSSLRLLDLLGYDPRGLAYDGVSGQGLYYPNVFPYPIMAYNCIYQYYYRLDAREKFNQQSFNVDRFYSDSAPQSDLLPHESFYMKYRPLDNDYFTDVKVSPIVDSLNLNSNTFYAAQDWLSQNSDISGVADSQNAGILTAFQQSLSGSGSGGFTGAAVWNNSESIVKSTGASPGSKTTHVLYSEDGSGSLLYGAAPNTITAYPSRFENPHQHSLSSGGSSVINTANIRAMFAAEKLWSITGRAKKNYDEQTLAHFGYKVPHDVKHQISCFGHDISRVHIGEVISTANTELSPLGEIAGKGYGEQSGQRHKFTAPCHGVVMAIFSVTLQHNYEGGYLKANMVTGRNDFYIPEFDHLGMQPLFQYETKFSEATDTTQGNILGWQYRYEQWKRRYNRTSGAFRNTTGSLKSWIPTFNPYCPTPVPAESALTNLPNTESYKCFLNLPTDGNQMFLAQYPTAWSTSFEGYDQWSAVYDNDPFVVNSHVDCVLVSSMSDYSLPRLDA